MPYIVTTKRPIASWPSHQDYLTVSRRAVATLEEAQAWCADYVHSAERASGKTLGRVDALPESGGTIGPLPDGTLISVEQISPLMLAARCSYTDGAALLAQTRAKDYGPLIDAFNAREGSMTP